MPFWKCVTEYIIEEVTDEGVRSVPVNEETKQLLDQLTSKLDDLKAGVKRVVDPVRDRANARAAGARSGAEGESERPPAAEEQAVDAVIAELQSVEGVPSPIAPLIQGCICVLEASRLVLRACEARVRDR